MSQKCRLKCYIGRTSLISIQLSFFLLGYENSAHYILILAKVGLLVLNSLIPQINVKECFLGIDFKHRFNSNSYTRFVPNFSVALH